MLCNSCNEDIVDEDALKCSVCFEYYHFMCATITEKNFRKMSKVNKAKWFCNKCKFYENAKSPLQNNTTNKLSRNCSNDNCSDLTESVNFMRGKFDNFGKQLQEIVSSLKEMRDENKVLKEHNIKLHNEISFLSNRVNILEQKAIENFIEIIGVPEFKEEDCLNTAKIMADKLGVESTVIKAFRVQSKTVNKSRKLVVELTCHQSSINAIICLKKQKPKGNMFHEKWGSEAIYVNNYLTQFNRNLHFKTKIFAREAGFKYVWFKDSKLFIKKNENSKAIHIENETTLALSK